MHSVTFYVNNSENYRADKSLTQVLNTSVALKGGSGVENVELDINTSVDITQCNYMYISDFGRYYFITSIAVIRNDVYRVSAHVDVLSTYKSQVRSLSAIIARQETLANHYLDDAEFKTLNKSEVVTKRFSGGAFTKNMQYVLVVAGG